MVSVDESANRLEMHSLLTPEQRLLLRCCAWRTGSDGCCPDLGFHLEPDWDRVIQTALSHGVLALVYRSIGKVWPGQVPAGVMERLRMAFLGNSARNLRMSMELCKILQLLKDNGVPAIPFKGPVLAEAVYGDMALRQFSDLDILVHPSDAVRAKDVLSFAGYRTRFPLRPDMLNALVRFQHHFSLWSSDGSSLVELHWTLDASRAWRRFSDVTVWERAGTTSFNKTPVKTLAPEDLLLYLCVHGANHLWERLLWICDVAATLERFPDLKWDALFRQAGMLRCKRMLFVGLLLAHELVSASVPGRIVSAARAYPKAEQLCRMVCSRLFLDIDDELHHVRDSFRFRFSVKEGLADRISFCVGRFLFPDALDLEQTALPERLSFLYYLLRPVRLAMKHLRRGP